MHVFSTFALFFALTLFTTTSWALGKLGHQLVCDIAYQQLSPSKQGEIDALLSQLPKNDKKRVNNFNHANVKTPMTYGKACTWPDVVKNDKPYKAYKKWHYVNFDRDTTKAKEKACKKDCITEAIPFHTEQLNADNTKDKLQALLFLGHWLGDLHTPMHVSFSSDWGGNKTDIKVDGISCDSMHGLWDVCLLTRQVTGGSLKTQYLPLWMKLSTVKDTQIQQWQQGSVTDWATESLIIARHPNTGYCSVEKGDVCAERKLPVPLNKAQLDWGSQQLNIRIQQAATRLAWLLEQHL
ncbi:S1/P1 nuclease [Thalassotalea euphylliae]|uniref:S1/P1 nuclease n=1 Tax=Thalassotalea euphylliae TaxID=1655234 RepID=UPI00363640B0